MSIKRNSNVEPDSTPSIGTAPIPKPNDGTNSQPDPDPKIGIYTDVGTDSGTDSDADTATDIP